MSGENFVFVFSSELFTENFPSPVSYSFPLFHFDLIQQKESSSVVQSPTLASAEPIQNPTSSEPESEPEPAPKQNLKPIPAPEATTTPLPPSSDTSLLPLLLQFLHLHSLALPTPGSKGLNPPLLPLALEKASPNEIAATGSLYEKLANGPLLGGEGDAMDLISKLEKGSEEKVFKTVSCEYFDSDDSIFQLVPILLDFILYADSSPLVPSYNSSSIQKPLSSQRHLELDSFPNCTTYRT